MSTASKLLAAAFWLLAAAVALHFMFTPFYDGAADPGQIWDILNWFMAVAVSGALVLHYLRKRTLDIQSDDGAVTRGYLEANLALYASVVLTVWFFWNWFDALTIGAGPQSDNRLLMWVFIDPFVRADFGRHRLLSLAVRLRQIATHTALPLFQQLRVCGQLPFAPFGERGIAGHLGDEAAVGAEHLKPVGHADNPVPINGNPGGAVELPIPCPRAVSCSGVRTRLQTSRRYRVLSGSETLWSLAPLGCPAKPGVERVADSVAEEIERQHRERNEQPGEKDKPPLRVQVSG